MRILVTGVGGPAGTNTVCLLPVGSVKAACDSNPVKRQCLERTGRHDIRFYTVPNARSSDAFSRAVNSIIKKENISIIIPTVDEELLVFSCRPGHFNARVVVSPCATIKTCIDKAVLYKSLGDQAFCPRHVVTDNKQDLASFGTDGVFMKPRVGRGSRGTRSFRNYSEIPREEVRTDNVFCEYLPGQEYTVDVLCDFDGRPVVIVPRKRLETKRGTSMKGETHKHPEILENVKKLCGILKFIGPVNIQFKPDSSGMMKIVEINPRFSGGLPITAESGANTPELLLRMLSGERVTAPDWTEGVFENKLVER